MLWLEFSGVWCFYCKKPFSSVSLVSSAMWLFVRVAWQFTTSFTVLFASSLKFSLLINYNTFHKKLCFYFTQDVRRPKGGNLWTKMFFECPEFSPLFLFYLEDTFHLNVIFFNYIFCFGNSTVWFLYLWSLDFNTVDELSHNFFEWLFITIQHGKNFDWSTLIATY